MKFLCVFLSIKKKLTQKMLSVKKMFYFSDDGNTVPQLAPT